MIHIKGNIHGVKFDIEQAGDGSDSDNERYICNLYHKSYPNGKKPNDFDSNYTLEEVIDNILEQANELVGYDTEEWRKQKEEDEAIERELEEEARSDAYSRR
jgi:hypothetical protein